MARLARHARLDLLNWLDKVERVESSRVEPSGIWAILRHQTNSRPDLSCSHFRQSLKTFLFYQWNQITVVNPTCNFAQEILLISCLLVYLPGKQFLYFFLLCCRFARVLSLQVKQVSRSLHLRFTSFTGDAMGMNMVSKVRAQQERTGSSNRPWLS